jgi:hypothetical protein
VNYQKILEFQIIFLKITNRSSLFLHKLSVNFSGCKSIFLKLKTFVFGSYSREKGEVKCDLLAFPNPKSRSVLSVNEQS